MRELRSKKETREIKKELKGKKISELKYLILELIPIKNASKKYLLERDSNKCRFCYCEKDLQIHHITPKINGGNNNENNLIILCKPCHMFMHCNPMLRTNNSNLVKAAVRTIKGVTKSYKGNKWGRKKLSKQMRTKIKDCVIENKSMSLRDIANKVGISKSAVHKYSRVIRDEIK